MEKICLLVLILASVGVNLALAQRNEAAEEESFLKRVCD